MGWPRAALEFGGQRTGLHGGAQTVGIHRRGSWRESDFHAFGPQLRQVVVRGAGIGVEIFPGTELHRVDEDRHDDDRSGHPLGRTHQREVAFVQRTHSRHQHHSPAGESQCATDIGDIPRCRVHIEFTGMERRNRHAVKTSTTSAGACARCAVRSAFIRYAWASAASTSARAAR
ncbi:Uncharacterised protein [Mycobacterium tuberculosis]|nr:Uncharacterised protein [Mycobacterium tuberculosis]CKP29958.1 Uncharacterised protein [Mycobacterium tuberculosis]CNM27903.1 Uncharacterised protein [Mycobacterium tuberculosis]CNM49505.1 Uncharacterised protein [Mycobacterium tuberculosis]CNM87372.1 Uncharacterised protein [Mycobacterium tuberculosis]